MTNDQTTPAPVEVTQADRDRAAKFISESDGDFAELAALFAAHRIAHSAPADLVELVEALRALRNRADDVADSVNTSLMEEAIAAADIVLAKHGAA